VPLRLTPRSFRMFVSEAAYNGGLRHLDLVRRVS
jgi:hypothetical protein